MKKQMERGSDTDRKGSSTKKSGSSGTDAKKSSSKKAEGMDMKEGTNGSRELVPV